MVSLVSVVVVLCQLLALRCGNQIDVLKFCFWWVVGCSFKGLLRVVEKRSKKYKIFFFVLTKKYQFMQKTNRLVVPNN